MRHLLGRVVQAYFIIGGVLGNIQFFSYTWLATWGAPAHIGFIAWMGFGVIAVAIGALSGVLRAVLWLPSLLLWCATQHEPFWRWLATGFYR